MTDTSENIVEVVKMIFGEVHAKVVKVMMENEGKEMRDEEIAKKIGMRVNEVRRVLYELHNKQIATYRKVIDPSTRWYTYYWKLNTENIYTLIKRRKRRVIELLKQRLEYERNNTFFKCTKGERCPIVTFDVAMEHYFKCPTCGAPLEQFDNSKIIELLEKKISELEEELKNDV